MLHDNRKVTNGIRRINETVSLLASRMGDQIQDRQQVPDLQQASIEATARRPAESTLAGIAVYGAVLMIITCAVQ